MGLSALLSHMSDKMQGQEPRSAAHGSLLLASCLAAQCLLRPWCICTPKHSHTFIPSSFLCTSNPHDYAFTMFCQPFSTICPTSSHISQVQGLDSAFIENTYLGYIGVCLIIILLMIILCILLLYISKKVKITSSMMKKMVNF